MAFADRHVYGYGYGFLSTGYAGFYLKNNNHSVPSVPGGIHLEHTSLQGANVQAGGTLDPDFFMNLEYSFFKNKYGIPLEPGAYGYIKSHIMTVNFQTDLNVAGPLRYYIGYGIGAVRLDYSGPLHGREKGIVYSAKAGAVYLAQEPFGLYMEAQYIKGDHIHGDVTGGYNIQGYTLLLGLRFFTKARK